MCAARPRHRSLSPRTRSSARCHPGSSISNMKTGPSCAETSGAEPRQLAETHAGTEHEHAEREHGDPAGAEPQDCRGAPCVKEPAEKDDPSGRSESDDDEHDGVVRLVLSGHSGQCATEDESHYITTHEIQLSEVSDHDGAESELSSSASWDLDDVSQVYSFVDYSFEDESCAQSAAAPVSTLLESDPCVAAKCASEPPEPPQRSGAQIHLSIRTSSRAINDSCSSQERENIAHHARRAGDVSGGTGAKAGTPGRVHVGQLRGKEVTDCSSGASSELDDADKEVRSLTARAFRSLAGPYLDALSFSTSSESSASERGINAWSAFVDLKYGKMNMSQGLDQSLGIAQNIENRAYKGAALSIKPPSSKILTLRGAPHGAASAQKIQLMGKFAQGHSGLIRLTETLNFRCNVKSGMSGGERRTQLAQSAAGSRSADEVTKKLLSGQLRGGSESPFKSMEDTHKKASFASSLIKNVLSKKMQFEQEQKMERGEICEPQQAPSPCVTHQGKTGRAPSAKLCESSSDCAAMCAEELADFVDSGSCDAKSDSWRKDATGSNLEPENEAGIDTKKGALDASRRTLPRSQNSAFRCWKDEELRFHKDHKNDQTLADTLRSAPGTQAERNPCTEGGSKATKMSHLFVPSIQLLPGDGDAGQQLQRDECGLKLRSNTLYITDSAGLATSKSPEIKINLRSVRDHNQEALAVSGLRAPDIDTTSVIREESKSQVLAAALKGESAEKVPHFTVRDFRDTKGKFQTPIHQVRDVRKLVKSSYHFVSLDNNENKSNFFSADSNLEQKKQMHARNPNSVSPIVIKCQSVNTNSMKAGGGAETPQQEPGDAGGAPQRPAGRRSSSSDGGRRPESKANRAALEKLQAAVKTMEQLYVFERNEWKRKSEPRPLAGSHVLSLLASEEDGAEGPRPASPEELKALQTSSRHDQSPNLQTSTHSTTQTPCSSKSFVPKSPLKPSEDYLTIPVTPGLRKPPPADKTSASTFSSQLQPTPPPALVQEDQVQAGRRSSIMVETRCSELPAAAIYHPLPLGMPASQPHMLCFSPLLSPGPAVDPFQGTQRRMLLDPTTGSYYLVDTPVQPTTKRLFDPETGQYVDVPMPPPPMTPVHMPVSPLALSPAAYGQTYMIYPGLMAAPSVMPSRTLAQPQLEEEGGKADGAYMDTPFYMATGRSSSGVQQQAKRGRGLAAATQPLISISSQQGPRIVAPPSFDGTTMSFVVEHR